MQLLFLQFQLQKETSGYEISFQNVLEKEKQVNTTAIEEFFFYKLGFWCHLWVWEMYISPGKLTDCKFFG